MGRCWSNWEVFGMWCEQIGSISPVCFHPSHSTSISSSWDFKVHHEKGHFFYTSSTLLLWEGRCLGNLSWLNTRHKEASLCAMCRWASFTAARWCLDSWQKTSFSSLGLGATRGSCSVTFDPPFHYTWIIWGAGETKPMLKTCFTAQQTIWELKIAEFFIPQTTL